MGRLFKNYDNKVTQAYKAGSHNGIDLVGKGENNYSCLDYIVAHSDGTVVEVVKNYTTTDSTGSSYGNYVKIQHTNGYYTLYAHMKYNSVTLNVGDTVKAGQVIGYMGNTGHSFGAHLHWEVRNENNVRIDPTSYINTNLPMPVVNNTLAYTKKQFLADLRNSLGLPATATLEQIYAATPMLHNNNTYNKVTVVLQKYLINQEYDCGKSGADGYFGDCTEKAVKAYQSDYATGVADGYLSAKGYMWRHILGL